MFSKPNNKIMRVETFSENVIKNKHHFRETLSQAGISDPEIIIVIEYVEVFNNLLVSEVIACKGHHLVKNGTGIAQTSVGFLRYYMQSFGLKSHVLVLCHIS